MTRVIMCCDTLTYSVAQTAKLLRVGETTLRRWLSGGELKYGIDRKGRMRIAGKTINNYLTKELQATL